MFSGSIPEWNSSGIIPANDPDNPVSPQRSPYSVSISDIVIRFGVTEERRRLLKGLLGYRSELHSAGIVEGFLWIDGSFVENVEQLEDKPPGDIDVVVFFCTPCGHTQKTLYHDFRSLFDRTEIRRKFAIDVYFVPLTGVPPKTIVDESVYWYSVWSHTERGLWKGYLQLSLDGAEDKDAMAELEQFGSAGGQP